VWGLGTSHVVLYEAKSDESPADAISVQTCRQAQGHKAWQKAHPFFTQAAEVIAVVVSPRTCLSSDAVPHAEGLYYVNADEIRAIFASSEASLRSIRSAISGVQSENILPLVMESIEAARLAPADLLSQITSTPLIGLPRA
jgi:hypothetical protein